jgi:DNA-binding NtrC family response regulator
LYSSKEGTKAMENKKTILFVQPDREFRKAIKKVLEKSGYVVITASEGREALDILSNNTVDLVISALRMPNINGMELMGEINRTKMSLPVIFLTVYGDVESYMDLMNMGAFDYINMPVNDQEILRVARSAIGEQCNSLRKLDYSKGNSIAKAVAC